jgi:NADPH:quinone reductase-like Zn-dependent oxidoreductase
MQAAVIEVLGQSPRYLAFPDPVAKEDEVLVKVCAAGLHPLVKSRASGSHYSSGGETPAVAGVDGVGVLADGSRVYFAMPRKPWGTMAELAAAPRATCIPIPEGLDDACAAAIANPGMSARVALKDRAGLAPGETVLIMGATGVAGQLAIQVARHLGAKRIVASGRNLDALAGVDVDATIDLKLPEDDIREALTAEAASGIDVTIDYLWGRPTELLLEALSTGFATRATHRTRLVEVGSMAGNTITLPGATLRSIDLHLLGSGFGAAPLAQILTAVTDLFAMAADGKLAMVADPVPLADVETAWNRVEKGRRIVFTI